MKWEFNQEDTYMENYNKQPPQYDYLSGAASSSGNTDTPELSQGNSLAIASLVLGIIGTVMPLFFGLIGSLIGLVAGIVGLILSLKAKKLGYVGGMRTAGLVLSIIAIVFGVLISLTCAACLASGYLSGLKWYR